MYYIDKTVRLLASVKLSIVLILCLFLLTLLGTLAQVDLGLHEAQKTYFDSWWLLQPIMGYEIIPLPGGLLVMAVLFVNLLVGGILRMRKSWPRLGVLIAHVGIAMILVSGFVKFAFAEEGGLHLYVGRSASEYGSFHEWEIVIAEPTDGDRVVEHIVPGKEFLDLSAGERVFRHTDLGLELRLSKLAMNCLPKPAGETVSPATPVRDGFFLETMALSKDAETNIAGCYVEVVDLRGGEKHEGLIWGAERYPFTVDVGGRRLGISLRKKRITLPFKVTLQETERQLHPGVMTAKAYSSEVLITDGDVTQNIHIEMNQPLRYKGIIFFQSGWGEADPATSMPRYSFFAVSRNPADSWPLWSCIVISIGLVLHFCRSLYRYIRKEIRRTT
jgi:ResB-like family